MTLRGCHILLGVSGSIAAFKTPHLIRLLKKAGAEVQVVTSPSALDFVTPLTLSTVSENPVYTQFTLSELGNWVNHVALAQWADLILVAPASLNTTGKWANAICDNLLMSVLFSAKCPCFIAPAMDLDMYQHPAFQAALDTIQHRGVHVIPAEIGALASGLEGQGRMAEPENIVKALEKNWLQTQTNWNGKRILITSGATREHLDPVRFLSNGSSGKMGVALAENLAIQGAEVIFIYGKDSLTPREGFKGKIKEISCVTADDMLQACMEHFPDCEGAILAAAVTDFKPTLTSPQKIKKTGEGQTFTFVENPDIAKKLGEIKKSSQFLLGFALETENGKENALNKMQRKKLDWIVLNYANQNGIGIGSDNNQVKVFSSNGEEFEHSMAPKSEIARFIIDLLY